MYVRWSMDRIQRETKGERESLTVTWMILTLIRDVTLPLCDSADLDLSELC